MPSLSDVGTDKELTPDDRQFSPVKDYERYKKMTFPFDKSDTSRGQLNSALCDLMNKTYEIINKAAENKGYKGMYSLTGREHAMGEIHLKVERYKKNRNPEDLVKIVGWCALLYRDDLRKELV